MLVFTDQFVNISDNVFLELRTVMQASSVKKEELVSLSTDHQSTEESSNLVEAEDTSGIMAPWMLNIGEAHVTGNMQNQAKANF